MGDRAGFDPAPVGSEPGGVAGGYRKRAREFRAPDALDRRARRRLLEDPPPALSSAVIASAAKQSIAPPRKNGLLRHGACHRPRIRATRWLLPMTIGTKI